jgi:hypothetical protein
VMRPAGEGGEGARERGEGPLRRRRWARQFAARMA